MSKRIANLRGLIYTHYNSESALADAIGWTRQRLNRITSGKKVPSLNDLDALAEALDTTVGELAQIFLDS